jgi:hypothetical protein
VAGRSSSATSWRCTRSRRGAPRRRPEERSPGYDDELWRRFNRLLARYGPHGSRDGVVRMRSVSTRLWTDLYLLFWVCSYVLDVIVERAARTHARAALGASQRRAFEWSKW